MSSLQVVDYSEKAMVIFGNRNDIYHCYSKIVSVTGFNGHINHHLKKIENKATGIVIGKKTWQKCKAGVEIIISKMKEQAYDKQEAPITTEQKYCSNSSLTPITEYNRENSQSIIESNLRVDLKHTETILKTTEEKLADMNLENERLKFGIDNLKKRLANNYQRSENEKNELKASIDRLEKQRPKRLVIRINIIDLVILVYLVYFMLLICGNPTVLNIIMNITNAVSEAFSDFFIYSSIKLCHMYKEISNHGLGWLPIH